MWYAVQTGTGREEAVKRQIDKRMPPVDSGPSGSCRILYYVKKRKYQGEWHEERERFLPGYVFLRADSPEAVLCVLDDPDKSGSEAVLAGDGPCPVGLEEEKLFARLSGKGDEIGMSYGVIEKGVLKIKNGMLAGLEPAVRKIDRHRRKGFISIRLADGRETLAGVGLEITEKS